MSMDKTSILVPARIIVFPLTCNIRDHYYLISKSILWKKHYTEKLELLYWYGNHLPALLAIFIP